MCVCVCVCVCVRVFTCERVYACVWFYISWIPCHSKEYTKAFVHNLLVGGALVRIFMHRPMTVLNVYLGQAG